MSKNTIILIGVLVVMAIAAVIFGPGFQKMPESLPLVNSDENVDLEEEVACGSEDVICIPNPPLNLDLEKIVSRFWNDSQEISILVGEKRKQIIQDVGEVSIDGEEYFAIVYYSGWLEEQCHVTGCSSNISLYKKDYKGDPGFAGLTYSGQNDILIEDIMDVDNDGYDEVVAKVLWCGASTCGFELKIFSWKNDSWINISEIGTYNGRYEFLDENQDGIKEIFVYKGRPGSVGQQEGNPPTESWYEINPESGMYELVKTVVVEDGYGQAQ